MCIASTLARTERRVMIAIHRNSSHVTELQKDHFKILGHERIMDEEVTPCLTHYEYASSQHTGTLRQRRTGLGA